MTRNSPFYAPSGARFALLGILLLMLSACASTPPPTALMSQASAAVDTARAAGADDFAPLELGFAVNKLNLAQSAMAQEDYALAGDLAAESQANSVLARVKAQLAKLREKIKQQSAENTRLRGNLVHDGAGAVQTGGGAA